ncbi:MAG: DUF362 domain-containing protein [Candidatus Nanoarchaeia archaeon]|nr:DUF362 domain-containing protein [Candidatus Nanoarchaeia archaeon]
MPKVVIVKAESYGNNLDKKVAEALKLAGFKPSKSGLILVKPNILRATNPKEAVNTNPEFVKAVVKEIRKHNKNIVVGDGVGKRKFSGEEPVLGSNGIEKAVRGLSKVKNFDDENMELSLDNPINKVRVARILKDAKYKISAPKLKTHMLTFITGAVKNHYGYLYKDYKVIGHARNWKVDDFMDFIIELYLKTKADFSIMDGIVGMEGEGPGSGTPVNSKVILASEDAFALDYVAAKIMGYEPESLLFFKKAMGKNLLNPKEIEVMGEKIENVAIKFKTPHSVSVSRLFFPIYNSAVYKFLRKRIKVNKEKCIKCAKCMKECPVGAIKMKPYPEIDNSKCIRCFCCIEHCPENALSLKGRISEWFDKKIDFRK